MSMKRHRVVVHPPIQSKDQGQHRGAGPKPACVASSQTSGVQYLAIPASEMTLEQREAAEVRNMSVIMMEPLRKPEDSAGDEVCGMFVLFLAESQLQSVDKWVGRAARPFVVLLAALFGLVNAVFWTGRPVFAYGCGAVRARTGTRAKRKEVLDCYAAFLVRIRPKDCMPPICHRPPSVRGTWTGAVTGMVQRPVAEALLVGLAVLRVSACMWCCVWVWVWVGCGWVFVCFLCVCMSLHRLNLVKRIRHRRILWVWVRKSSL